MIFVATWIAMEFVAFLNNVASQVVLGAKRRLSIASLEASLKSMASDIIVAIIGGLFWEVGLA